MQDEIRNYRSVVHGIDSHNRRACAGWSRAWTSEVVDHRHATADGPFADKAGAETFPAQVTTSINDALEVRTSILFLASSIARRRSRTREASALRIGGEVRRARDSNSCYRSEGLRHENQVCGRCAVSVSPGQLPKPPAHSRAASDARLARHFSPAHAPRGGRSPGGTSNSRRNARVNDASEPYPSGPQPA